MHKRRYKGFDYGACNHPDLPQPVESAPSPVEWEHVGGGWYDNVRTGERRLGKSEEGDEAYYNDEERGGGEESPKAGEAEGTHDPGTTEAGESAS